MLNEDQFIRMQAELIKLIEDFDIDGLSQLEASSYPHALKILNGYTFENRHWKKGNLAYAVVDSCWGLDNELAEKLIQFDNYI